MTGRLRVLEAGAALIVGFLVLAPLVALVWPAGAPVDGGAANACAGAVEEPLAKKPAWAGRGKDTLGDADRDKDDAEDDSDDDDDGDKDDARDDGKGKGKPGPALEVAGGLPSVPVASGPSVQC